MNTVVLYPVPRIGHIISMVELGKLLLTNSKSLTSVTILVPSYPLPLNESIPAYISSVSSSFPSITFHSLPSISLLRGHPSNYPNVESITYESLRSNNPNAFDALKSLSSSSHVSAFILDFFCYPAVEIPQSLNVPSYFFFTCGACALALFLNFPVFDEVATDSFRNLNMSLEIPGLFAVPSSQMIEPMLDRGESYDEFVKMGSHMPKADGIIINTFESLEVRAVKALEEGTCAPGTDIPPVYCVGPLIANRGLKEANRHECLGWLDMQPHRSVVYLAFGSRGMFSKEQIREIALGLERSGVRFLWVVRAPPVEVKDSKFDSPADQPELGSILPEGFMERTRDRGLVVKSWAPQITVLAHESIGGFVTHCGWNSILEAVCAGVPMVAWPLYAEQRFNKIVLVQEIGVALPINESEDRFVSSDEIERRVKQIVDSEGGSAVRKRVQDLKNEVVVALSQIGSSKTTLSRLVDSWKLSTNI